MQMGLTALWLVAVWVCICKMGLMVVAWAVRWSRVVVASRRGQRQDGSLLPLNFSLSQVSTTLYSLGLSRLSLSLSRTLHS